MSIAITENALFTLATLGALWVLVFLCWRSYAIDAFRLDLEQLKSELSGLAFLKKIDLSQPSCQLLQSRIDAMITFAPRLNIVHLLVAWLFRRSYQCAVTNPLDEPGQGHPMREQLVAINHWLLLRAFFQAVHLPAVLIPSFRVVWGLSTPASHAGRQIESAVAKLRRMNLIDPIKILVYQAVEAQLTAATSGKAASQS